MKIYFSGSIRGGREHAQWYDFIVKQLSGYGEVLSEFVADKTLTSYGSLNMTNKEIYNRDINFVNEADIVVAEVTTPSLGVGYEIAYAEKLGKRIYCLYHQIEDKRVSAMIAGSPHCQVFTYKEQEELSEIIKNIFE